MLTIVDSMINFILSWVEHDKSFITSDPGPTGVTSKVSHYPTRDSMIILLSECVHCDWKHSLITCNIRNIFLYTLSKVKHCLNVFQEKKKHEFILVTFMKLDSNNLQQIYGSHMFFHAWTFAVSRRSCLNTWPLGWVFKYRPRDPAIVNAMKKKHVWSYSCIFYLISA